MYLHILMVTIVFPPFLKNRGKENLKILNMFNVSGHEMLEKRGGRISGVLYTGELVVG